MKSMSPDPFRNEHIPWKRMRWHLRWVMFEAFWAGALGLLNANTKLGSYWRRRVSQNVRLMQDALNSLLILSARNAPPSSSRPEAQSAGDAGTQPSTLPNADGWVPASARLTPLGGNDGDVADPGEMHRRQTIANACSETPAFTAPPPTSSRPEARSAEDAGTQPATLPNMEGWVPASARLKPLGGNDSDVADPSESHRHETFANAYSETPAFTPPPPTSSRPEARSAGDAGTDPATLQNAVGWVPASARLTPLGGNDGGVTGTSNPRRHQTLSNANSETPAVAAPPSASFRPEAHSAEDAGTQPSTLPNMEGWVPASARLTPLGGNDGGVIGTSDPRLDPPTSPHTPPRLKRNWGAWARSKLNAIADIFADPTVQIDRMAKRLAACGYRRRAFILRPPNTPPTRPNEATRPAHGRLCVIDTS